MPKMLLISQIGVSQHDGVVAIRARGNHGYWHTCDLLNPLQVQARIDWQFVKVSDTHRHIIPAFQRFVDRLAPGDVVCAHGQNVNHFTI